MIRSILACTVVAMVGFAKSAYAATYADYNLDTSVGASYASPASIIAQSYGTVGDLKGVCDGFPDCIAVLYQASAGGGVLLKYDPQGFNGASAGYSSLSWRYDAPSSPTCFSATDNFVDATGNCQCEFSENQNTNFGCSQPLKLLVPSGGLRRVKKMARNIIMPGVPAPVPAF